MRCFAIGIIGGREGCPGVLDFHYHSVWKCRSCSRTWYLAFTPGCVSAFSSGVLVGRIEREMPTHGGHFTITIPPNTLQEGSTVKIVAKGRIG